MGTAAIRFDKIAGGFVRVDGAEVLHAWHACLDGPPGAGGFRAWLACREIAARRRGLEPGRSPSYGVPELANLLGVSPRTAAASLRSIVAAGLVAWSEDAIAFPTPPTAHEAADGPIADTIAGGRGPIAIPRRILRYLARGARPALIATALAALLRCVSRRRDGFASRGRLAASWVANAFGVDLRRVKQARAELVALGWLTPEPSDPWATNRWGAPWAVDLAWRRPRNDCHPSPAQSGASLPPPDLHPDPLRGQLDPEPAKPGPAGASLQDGGPPPSGSTTDPEPSPGDPDDAPVVMVPTWDREAGRFVEVAMAVDPLPQDPPLAPRPAAISSPLPPSSVDPRPTQRGLPPASLAHVRAEDLEDTVRALELHRQAVAARRITSSERDRVRFVAAVEHAVAVGKVNPPGLLARIVANGWWHLITQGDEDRASRRLREHQRPAPAPPPTSRPASPAGFGSPYGAERSSREPTALAGLLSRMATDLHRHGV